MKNTILLIFALIPHFLLAQNFGNSRGAQGGALGISDCYPFESTCPEEFNAEILLILKTDGGANETSWQIEDQTEGTIIASGDSLAADSIYQVLICAYTDNCYQFTIFDSQGNGIDTTQNKGFFIYWNGILVDSGGSFENSDSTMLGACCTNFTVELLGGFQCTYKDEGQVYVETKGGTPPFDYLWSNGVILTETQFVSTSDDQISVTVTDASNCVASDTFLMADLTPMELVVETVPVAGCDPNSGEASVSVLRGIPPYTYSWSSGGNKLVEKNLAYGTHMVTVTDASRCIAESIATISGFSPIIISVDSTTGETPDRNNGAIFISVSGGSGQSYSYAWKNESNEIVSELEDPTGLSAGTFTLTVTDGMGCSVTHTVLLALVEGISLSHELDNMISLAPNPTSGKVFLTMNFQEYQEVQIMLYDNQGRVITTLPQKKIQNESIEWDFSNYSAGVYFFKIIVDGRVITKKLIFRN